MTKLIPPLSDLVALSQNPIQGALRAQILPLIEKRGVNLSRRLVTKPLSVENTQHRLALLNRQCPGMAAHLSRLCSGTLRSVIARPCHAQCLTGGLYPQGTLLLPDHRHQSFSTLCFSSIPKISETFFWSSTKPSARSARALSRAVSRSRTLTLSANGFLGLGEGPRFRDNPSSSPLSRCLRHCVRFEEYNPSRLRSAPISPRPLQAAAARKIRSLYSAVYRRRTGLAITSTSEGDNPNPSIVSIIDSLLAPYSTLNSRRVSVSSILAEREGTDSYLHMIHERLTLMKELLTERGSIYVHCDHRVNHLLKGLLEEIFGRGAFRNEIVWQKIRVVKAQSASFGNVHDVLINFSKSAQPTFNQQKTE